MKTIYVKTIGQRISAQPGQSIVTPSGERRKGFKAKQAEPAKPYFGYSDTADTGAEDRIRIL